MLHHVFASRLPTWHPSNAEWRVPFWLWKELFDWYTPAHQNYKLWIEQDQTLLVAVRMGNPETYTGTPYYIGSGRGVYYVRINPHTVTLLPQVQDKLWTQYAVSMEGFAKMRFYKVTPLGADETTSFVVAETQFAGSAASLRFLQHATQAATWDGHARLTTCVDPTANFSAEVKKAIGSSG